MGTITDKINIDFQIISTGNPATLVVVDTSVWGNIENKPAIIEITTPERDTYVTHYFEKKKVNVFNTSNLYLSDIGDYKDMSDGLYIIEVKGSPDTYSKKRYFLKDDLTKLELYKVYASLGIENDAKTRKIKEEIQHAETLIRGANALIALGKINRAQEMLEQVMKILKDFNNCKGC